MPKMRQSKVLKRFLDAVNIAALAIMLGVLYQMSIDTLIDWQTCVILIESIVLVFFVKKAGVITTVVLGSLLGYIFYLI